MTTRPRQLFTRLVVLALAAAGLAGCGGAEQPRATSPETAANVALTTVQPTSLPQTFEAVGTVRAAQTSPVASQLQATVTQVLVTEGTRVHRGQTLVVLDDAQPRAALDQAQAAVRAAEQEAAAAEADNALAASTFKRYQELYEKKSVSPHEFDQVKAQQQAATARRAMAAAGLERAQAALQQAKTSFDYTRVRAPYDGVVTEKNVDPGALASPGSVLLTVEDTRHFRLEAPVDEGDIDAVRPQQEVPVVIEALGTTFNGRVARIVPAADAATRTFLVKIDLPADPRLRSGLFGRALFPRGERSGLLVPASAVVDRGQLQGLYVVGDENVLSLSYVTLGQPHGDEVEVLSGLSGGERVVTNPGGRELAGKRVGAATP